MFYCILDSDRSDECIYLNVPILPPIIRTHFYTEISNYFKYFKHILKLTDSGPGNDRILIFGRQKSLDILFRSKTWFGDGIFRTAPLLFTQVYVILAEQFGGVHPIIFALLPDKQSKTYEKLFDMLLKLKPG